MVKEYLVEVLVVIGVLFFIYATYLAAKEFNYSMMYEDKVIETIRDTVNEECLNELVG